MRGYLQPLVALGLAVGLIACGADAGGPAGPVCGGGFAEETYGRYDDGEPTGDCLSVYYFSGVFVDLPDLPRDEGWTLHGLVGDEPFTCTYVPGMVEGDRCTDHPKVRWTPWGVELRAHPCQLELHLERGGVEIAAARVRPEYEWSEPNGEGCGWVVAATVELVPIE